MDFLDICMGRYYQTYAGRYYEHLPDNSEDGDDAAIHFDYEYVDVTNKAYKQLITNLTEAEGITTAIKTREHHAWKIGSFIILSDGKLCIITAISEDRSNAQRESGRLHAIPLGTEYILKLTEYENPRGIL